MASILDGVSFGEFELDLTTCELQKAGKAVKLQPQPARVLCLLVSHPGKLISREEIRRLLWGDTTFVDYESGVDYCINRIRSVLGDKAQSPRYIETLPRRGYRFIASVERHRPFVEPTLAVLPFANLNGDPTIEFFADGVTDALITELARIQAVRVISRQSVLYLKGSGLKLDEIARDLRVDGIVEGAVLHEGNRARVNAQLILMDPERHVWAQSYDCNMSAILDTQRDAAREIAVCVAAALNPAEPVTLTPALVPVRPVTPEIIEAYLKARTELDKMSAEGIGKALRRLREITLKAPDFALGLAWHAGCLVALGYWGNLPLRETYPSAKYLALNALAIDESMDAAHYSLGMVTWLLDWDLAAAEREFQRALELSPSNPDAHTFYAIFLSSVGRLSEGSDQIRYALRLDSTSLLPNSAAAWIYLHQHHHEKAEDQARRTLELFAGSIHAYFVLGWAAWSRRRTEEAIVAFEKALSLSREAFSLSFLGHIYGCVGRRDEAISLLRELDRLSAQSQAPPIAFTIIHAGLGDLDAAFDWLEIACRLQDDKLFWLPLLPAFEPLRPDLRFAPLVHRIPSLA